MLFTLLAFAVALGVLITFHELGHYWVARRCGVKVLRFSVGFGRVVARRVDRHGTEWALSAIPLGGYVKMQDEPPEEATSAQIAESFNHKSLAQRSAVVVAGPLANLLLAALLYTALGLAGTTQPAAVLAQPPANTPAAEAGFQAGDRITRINQSPVQSWNEARWSMLDALTSGGQLDIDVDTAQGVQRARVLQAPAPEATSDDADLMADAGLRLAAPRPRIAQVAPGQAGAEAGLREGDIIIGAGALHEPTASELVSEIQKHPDEAMVLTVLRNGDATQLSVIPRSQHNDDGARVGRIGVVLGADFPMVVVRYGLFDSIHRGVARTGETVWLSLKMIGRMITGQASLRNVSGPVTIADYAGQTARMGLAAYIGFLALISVSIGVLNLLPIPMLDGGHLLYYALEAVRGKPVPEKWMDTGHRIGLGLLAVLMALAFFNDFSRLFS